MTLYGVTSAGFVRKSLNQALIDFGARLVQQFGIALDTSAQSVVGEQAALFMSEADSLWELAQQVYDSHDPAKAEGQPLDVLASYKGTIRKAATFSTVTLILVGTNGTVVSSSSQAKNSAGDVVFRTTAPATIATSAVWAATHAYVVVDRVSKGGQTYVATQAGTSGSTGPTGSTPYPATSADGSVVWVWVGTGLASVTVAAQPSTTGPIAAPAFSLTSIGTPTSGWAAVANYLDAVVGSDIEDDTSLRQRRLVELPSPGSSRDAIRAAVSKLTGVTFVVVFENTLDTTNADGMPPHSVEVVVQGSASSSAIATAIASTVAAGIQTKGGTTVTLTDSQGANHDYKYSTPTTVNIYLAIDIEIDGNFFPSNGASIAEDVAIAFGQALRIGDDVEPSAIIGALFVAAENNTLPGIVAVTVTADTSAITGSTPVDTTVPINGRALAVFDSTRTTVTTRLL